MAIKICILRSHLSIAVLLFRPKKVLHHRKSSRICKNAKYLAPKHQAYEFSSSTRKPLVKSARFHLGKKNQRSLILDRKTVERSSQTNRRQQLWQFSHSFRTMIYITLGSFAIAGPNYQWTKSYGNFNRSKATGGEDRVRRPLAKITAIL